MDEDNNNRSFDAQPNKSPQYQTTNAPVTPIFIPTPLPMFNPTTSSTAIPVNVNSSSPPSFPAFPVPWLLTYSPTQMPVPIPLFTETTTYSPPNTSPSASPPTNSIIPPYTIGDIPITQLASVQLVNPHVAMQLNNVTGVNTPNPPTHPHPNPTTPISKNPISSNPLSTSPASMSNSLLSANVTNQIAQQKAQNNTQSPLKQKPSHEIPLNTPTKEASLLALTGELVAFLRRNFDPRTKILRLSTIPASFGSFGNLEFLTLLFKLIMLECPEVGVLRMREDQIKDIQPIAKFSSSTPAPLSKGQEYDCRITLNKPPTFPNSNPETAPAPTVNNNNSSTRVQPLPQFSTIHRSLSAQYKQLEQSARAQLNSPQTTTRRTTQLNELKTQLQSAQVNTQTATRTTSHHELNTESQPARVNATQIPTTTQHYELKIQPRPAQVNTTQITTTTPELETQSPPASPQTPTRTEKRKYMHEEALMLDGFMIRSSASPSFMSDSDGDTEEDESAAGTPEIKRPQPQTSKPKRHKVERVEKVERPELVEPVEVSTPTPQKNAFCDSCGLRIASSAHCKCFACDAWFHLACVKLRKQPERVWLCKSCEKYQQKAFHESPVTKTNPKQSHSKKVGSKQPQGKKVGSASPKKEVPVTKMNSKQAPITNSNQSQWNNTKVLVQWNDGMWYAAQVVGTTPDGSAFTVLFEDGTRATINKSKLNQHNEVVVPQGADFQDTFIDDMFCKMCSRGDAEDRMLLCDKCDGCYHTFCLTPPLESIPEGQWFCPLCTAAFNGNK